MTTRRWTDQELGEQFHAATDLADKLLRNPPNQGGPVNRAIVGAALAFLRGRPPGAFVDGFLDGLPRSPVARRGRDAFPQTRQLVGLLRPLVARSRANGRPDDEAATWLAGVLGWTMRLMEGEGGRGGPGGGRGGPGGGRGGRGGPPRGRGGQRW